MDKTECSQLGESDLNENKGSKKRIQLKEIGQNMVFTVAPLYLFLTEEYEKYIFHI